MTDIDARWAQAIKRAEKAGIRAAGWDALAAGMAGA